MVKDLYIAWSGSVFECRGTNNEIILFGADLGYFVCNKGAIKARRINCTSQLIITDRSLSGIFSLKLNGH